ncbi:MAG: MG2 domain-containing protein, partial [bacterium]
MTNKTPFTENQKSSGRLIAPAVLLVVFCLIIGAIISNALANRNSSKRIGSYNASSVTIASVQPTGETDEKTNITVEFTHAMVQQNQVGIEVGNEIIRVEPEITGICKWIAVNKLRFYPFAPLNPATNYDASIIGKLRSVDGLPLKGELGFSFYTSPLKVKYFSGYVNYINDESGDYAAELAIYFNHPVLKEQFQKHFEMDLWDTSRNKTKLNYTIQASESDTKYKIVSETVDRAQLDNRTIKIKLSEGLKSKSGDLGLGKDYISAFGIETNLKVNQIKAVQNRETRYIQIEFSTPITTKNIREYISVQPEIKFKIESEDRIIKLKGPFKADNWYTVGIKRGLAGVDGRIIEKDLSQKVKIGDLEPSINFKNDGTYLPLSSSRKISLETVNIEKVTVEVSKIFKNNLVRLMQNSGYYDYWYSVNDIGRIIETEEIETTGEKNETVSTLIDVGKYYQQDKKGIYQIRAREVEQYWSSDSKLIMVTDMGLTASLADDDLFVWVNSFSTLKAVPNATIKLYSDNNQLITTGKTNNNGVLIVENLGILLEDEKFIPFLITAEKGDDFSFMKFESCRMPLTTFDIGGRNYLSNGYEAFLFADRDVFRPNDEAHVAAIVRGVGMRQPESFPIKLKVLDPMDRTFEVFLKTMDKSGVLDFNLNIPDYAMTGNYIAQLLVADDEIGRLEFIVEDFIPDKTKVEVQTDKQEYRSGETIKIGVKGEYLFGPPAANNDVECKIQIMSFPYSNKKWADYTFGDSESKFSEVEINLGSARLDEKGNYMFEATVPKNMNPPSALKASISVTLKETGGRAVSTRSEVTVHPYPYYIGLRQQVKGYAEIGKDYKVDFAVVNPEGVEESPKKLNVDVYKIVYNSVRRRGYDGMYQWVSDRSDELVDSFEIVPAENRMITYKPDDYGMYKIIVFSPDQNVSSAITFYASGWGYSPWSMENPDRVEIELDRNLYRVKDKAKVLIKSPFPGKLLLTILREKVFDYRIVDMPKNTATIEIPVKAEYKPNVYISATVIKSMDDFDGESPMRAFGISPLMVDTTDRKLLIEISSPEETQPGKMVNLSLNVKNKKGVSYLALSAVDEGILQLTDFQTPDPFDFFYGKKRLNAEYFDIFSYVLPDLAKLKSTAAGDGYDDERKKHLSPVGIKRVEPISLWSGILKTDSNGKANIKFEMPEFQGRMRIMAVGVNEAYVGNSDVDMFVRDRIVLNPTVPRFLSSLDEFKVPVSVFNRTSKAGTFEVKLTVDGDVKIQNEAVQKIEIANNEEKTAFFNLKVGNTIGSVTFHFTASGLNEKTSSSVNLPIRPSSPVITKTDSVTISDGKPADIQFPGNFVEGTKGVKLIISAFPQIQFSQSLQYLLEYPHGCIEQTTSRVFPLLYFEELAKAVEPELFKENTAWYFVEEGISKIVSMQQYNGSFSYWPNDRSVNDWGSVYAAHFLVEARKAGYEVPDSAYDEVIEWLNGYVKTQFDKDYQLQQQVYACLVLSLAGTPPKSSINYFMDSRLSELSVAAQFQLAHCYVLMGDRKTAQELLPDDIQPVKVERETGMNFRSSIRENAIMLMALYEISPDHPGIPVLVTELSNSAEFGRWYTTQENAYALMAIGKVLQKRVDTKFTGKVTIEGKVFAEFDTNGFKSDDAAISGKRVNIGISGTGQCYAYWQAWGVPTVPDFDEYDRGISVRREYLDIGGKSLDYKKIKHGDLIVAKITMKALKKDLENVIIDDMLPAGFEIENPRILSRAQIPWVIDQKYQPDYVDMRDDRL